MRAQSEGGGETPAGAGAGSRVAVDAIDGSHHRQWLDLWGQYLQFYGVRLPERVTAHTWRRMLDCNDVIGLGAVRDGTLVGFAIGIRHEATWSIGRAVYLEDLFVRAEERGRGLGRQLIEELMARAKASGCASIYWHTRAGNGEARRLYDRFVDADDYVRYRLAL